MLIYLRAGFPTAMFELLGRHYSIMMEAVSIARD